MFGTVQRITTAAGTTPIPVASTATVYTPAFKLSMADAFGLSLLAASDGTVDVLVQLEECNEDTAPTSETADTNSAVPDGFADIINLTDENIHVKQLNPVPAKWARFKLVGQGSNDASTTVRIDLFRQEKT